MAYDQCLLRITVWHFKSFTVNGRLCTALEYCRSCFLAVQFIVQYFHGVHRIGLYEGVFLETASQKKFPNNHIVKLILYSRTNVNFC